MVSKALGKMINYFGNDIKRVNHALKVYAFAKTICGNELVSEESGIVTELAAVLHDIGIKEAERKYNSAAGKYQELEGPPIAKEILADMDIENTVMERVCHLIGNHHSYGKIDGKDFQILVEADFLVNIEEDSFEASAIQGIKEKYFETETGKGILKSLYGI